MFIFIFKEYFASIKTTEDDVLTAKEIAHIDMRKTDLVVMPA